MSRNWIYFDICWHFYYVIIRFTLFHYKSSSERKQRGRGGRCRVDSLPSVLQSSFSSKASNIRKWLIGSKCGRKCFRKWKYSEIFSPFAGSWNYAHLSVDQPSVLQNSFFPSTVILQWNKKGKGCMMKIHLVVWTCHGHHATAALHPHHFLPHCRLLGANMTFGCSLNIVQACLEGCIIWRGRGPYVQEEIFSKL